MKCQKAANAIPSPTASGGAPNFTRRPQTRMQAVAKSLWFMALNAEYAGAVELVGGARVPCRCRAIDPGVSVYFMTKSG